MLQSWLQRQAALSTFDGYGHGESRSCVKPTTALAASCRHTADDSLPEAGGVSDIVYDPTDAAADWSGFAPKHSIRRKQHAEPAAHREVNLSMVHRAVVVFSFLRAAQYAHRNDNDTYIDDRGPSASVRSRSSFNKYIYYHSTTV